VSDFFLRGINDVGAERLRQIEEEGFSSEKDDQYEPGTLAVAGACYGVHAAFMRNKGPEGLVLEGVPEWWPWESSWWKPSENLRQNLVKGAALLIAEIDKIDREEAQKNQVKKDPTKIDNIEADQIEADVLEAGQIEQGGVI
jgi:hypothetical protein